MKRQAGTKGRRQAKEASKKAVHAVSRVVLHERITRLRTEQTQYIRDSASTKHTSLVAGSFMLDKRLLGWGMEQRSIRAYVRMYMCTS